MIAYAIIKTNFFQFLKPDYSAATRIWPRWFPRESRCVTFLLNRTLLKIAEANKIATGNGSLYSSHLIPFYSDNSEINIHSFESVFTFYVRDISQNMFTLRVSLVDCRGLIIKTAITSMLYLHKKLVVMFVTTYKYIRHTSKRVFSSSKTEIYVRYTANALLNCCRRVSYKRRSMYFC